MTRQQHYRPQAPATLINAPMPPRASAPPAVEGAGQQLMKEALNFGTTIVGMQAKEHARQAKEQARQQQGLADDALLEAESEFRKWKHEYTATHRGRDALSAEQDYTAKFAEIAQGTLERFGNENTEARQRLERGLKLKNMYALDEGSAYQRREEAAWGKNRQAAQEALFFRTVQEDPDNGARLDMERAELLESWQLGNPGMDGTAYALELDRKASLGRLDAWLARGDYECVERALGGGQAVGDPGGAPSKGGAGAVRLPARAAALAEKAAAETGVAPELIRAVMSVESGGREDAVSPVGARGLMQLMPGTAADLGVNPDDPEENVRGGARYLGQMLNRYGGNREHALMAYNWGPGNVDAWLKTGKGARGQEVPEETRKYVTAVSGRMGAGGEKEPGQPSLPGLPGLTATDVMGYRSRVESTRRAHMEQVEKERELAEKARMDRSSAALVQAVRALPPEDRERRTSLLFELGSMIPDPVMRERITAAAQKELDWEEKAFRAKQDAIVADFNSAEMRGESLFRQAELLDSHYAAGNIDRKTYDTLSKSMHGGPAYTVHRDYNRFNERILENGEDGSPWYASEAELRAAMTDAGTISREDQDRLAALYRETRKQETSAYREASRELFRNLETLGVDEDKTHAAQVYLGQRFEAFRRDRNRYPTAEEMRSMATDSLREVWTGRKGAFGWKEEKPLFEAVLEVPAQARREIRQALLQAGHPSQAITEELIVQEYNRNDNEAARLERMMTDSWGIYAIQQ